MIEKRKASKIILSLLSEDSYGLYEIIWALNSAFPREPLCEKYRVAGLVVADLLRKKNAKLVIAKNYSRARSLFKDVEKGENNKLLSSPVSWYPGTDSKTVLVALNG